MAVATKLRKEKKGEKKKDDASSFPKEDRVSSFTSSPYAEVNEEEGGKKKENDSVSKGKKKLDY